MSPMQDVEMLADQIRHHNELYTNSQPDITDKEYDDLISELKTIDPNHPVLMEVGAVPSYGKKVVHAIPMGSLNKISYDPKWELSNVDAWYASHPEKVVWSMKIDGIAGELLYHNGMLVGATTRGNGQEGLSVLDNVRAVKSIPTVLSDSEFEPFVGVKTTVKTCDLRIRGEFYIPRSFFNAKLAGTFANPRNAVAGAMNCVDANATADKGVAFLAYRLFVDDVEVSSLSKMEEIVNSLQGHHGILPCEMEFVELSPERLSLGLVEQVDKDRKGYDFQSDGLVLAVDDTDSRNKYGFSGLNNLGMVAFKFRAVQEVTELVGIQWNATKSQRVTPLALLKPVHIDGSWVAAATLYNLSEIKRLDIAVGDKVLVEKAGDIIPRVVRVVERVAERNINYPHVCTCCGEKTIEQLPFVMCLNPNCQTQTFGDVVVWAQAMGYDDFKGAPMKMLFDAKILADPTGYYSLTASDLAQIPRVGPAIAERIFNQIQASRKVDTYRFLCGLGILGVGGTSIMTLVQKHPTLAEVRNLTIEQMSVLPRFGFSTSRKIHDGLIAKKDLIDRLLALVEVVPYEKKESKGPLKGLSFCLTGTLSRKRKDVEAEIVSLGGTIAGVSPGLSYLLVGEDAGSKLDKAKKYGLKVIDEAGYKKLVEAGNEQS